MLNLTGLQANISQTIPNQIAVNQKVISQKRINKFPCSLNIQSPMKFGLTAGKAKKEMPRRANPADSIRPVHVFGVLSP